MAKSTFLDFSTTAGDNTDCGGIGILGTNSVSNFDNAFRTLMAILRRDLDNGTVFATKSGAYTAVANDNNAFYEFTATATLTLTAAATLGADWHMMVFANGGDVTIDADGTELINGEETLVVADGDATYLICTGSAFVAITIPTGSAVSATVEQSFTAAEKGQAIANIGGGDLAGLRNKVINPLFAVNQRGKSGTVTLTAGQYGHDRFKAGASGCTYTFSTTNGVTTLTISAGTIQQVIEDACFAGASGEYFLSWGGTAQGRVNSGSYGNSGEVSATCNGSANVTVEWGTGTLSLPQFERGFVTALSPRHPQQELALCQRYYEVTQLLISAGHDVSSSQHVTWAFRTRKRTTPTVTADWNSTTPSTTTVNVDSVRFFNTTAFYQAPTQTARADSEL